MNTFQDQWQFPFSYMLQYFGTALFLEKLLLHTFSVQIFSIKTVIFSEQLFLQSSCLFWGAPFLEQSLFPSIIFLEYLFFLSETSTQKPDLENWKFSSAVTFQNSYSQKTSTEELLFRSRFFCTTSTFSKKQDFGKSYFSRKAKFHITYFFLTATFVMPFS